ncbi:GDP-L-fucose synthase [Kaistia defluvii]|uniref:GDP-L-fucose synthase n=1 Tax=Kaistia defluvii TaxID=410841 RepID=A0ABV2QT79_9HYPH
MQAEIQSSLDENPAPLFDLAGTRVFVAGHRGMAGRALVRRLATEGCEVLSVARDEVDLRNQAQTATWLTSRRPDVVFLAAAKVGGIVANNSYPADFLLENLQIETNVIDAAYHAGVKKLLFLGSSCIYPRLAAQPIVEEALLSGALEPTNEWYAIAKIAGVKLCQAFRRQHGADFVSIMPTNLYGPGDNYHPEHSHAPAGLIRRIHEAKASGQSVVEVWGTGTPRREFLSVDDLADASVHVMKHYSDEVPLNVGTGSDISMREFAELIAEVVGYRGRLAFDTSRPDGTPRKLLDVSRMTDLGWRARIDLRAGLTVAYADFLTRFG